MSKISISPRWLEDFVTTEPDQARLEIEAALRRLVRQGLIYDTGKRRWSERSQQYQIVWAAVRHKTLN